MSKLKHFLNLLISTPLIFTTLFNDGTIHHSPVDCTIHRSPVEMFIFGDSYFDPGNNNYINTTSQYRANYPPYGETTFVIPTGRFSDGILIADIIGEYANLGLIPPYLKPRSYENYVGANFASGGGGVLSKTNGGLVINMRTQLKYYKREIAELAKKTGKAEAARISSKAVYFFSLGTNDYNYNNSFIFNSTHYSRSKYVETVIGNLSIILKEIYLKGGRKFVFLNLVDLGCLPGMRILSGNGGCLEQSNDFAALHNKALPRMLSKMERKLYGFEYYVYDYNYNLAQRTSNPSKYGFKDGLNACCGSGDFNGIYSCGGKRAVSEDFNLCENPNEFIYWDPYHLTQRVYLQMAEQMWNTTTLKRFFLCF